MLDALPPDVILDSTKHLYGPGFVERLTDPAEMVRVGAYFLIYLLHSKKTRRLEDRVGALERERNLPMYNLTWNGTPNYSRGRYLNKVDRIVIHWLNGDLRMADAAFSRRERRASAHFAVEGSEVHQYVKLSDTAWHAGNWLVNLKSVGIEHSAQPGRELTPEGYQTSAELICDICRQLNLVPSRALLHGHSEYAATQCPGTINLDRLAELATSIWFAGADRPVGSAPTGTPASATAPVEFQVQVTTGLRVRTGPGTNYQERTDKRLKAGDTLWCNGSVRGEAVSGNATWYKTKVSGLYIWSGGTKRI